MNLKKLLYTFLFTNAFISGIFGLFLPIYLYKMGATFSNITLFIAINAFFYVITLRVIEYIIPKINLKHLTQITFLTYGIFITSIFFTHDINFKNLLILGFFNGIYLSLFWTIQRLTFLTTINEKNLGKQISNIQLFIMFISKIGILIGGFILENLGFKYVFLITIILLSLSTLYTIFHKTQSQNYTFTHYKPHTLKEILTFKDNHNSKLIFIFDGLFLYIESYIWLLVIFLYVGSFFELGILIILFSVIFITIYSFIRKIIDKTPEKKLIKYKTIIYGFGWFLAGIFVFIENTKLQSVLILFIAFFNILFRLTFNKIFFKISKNTLKERYIFLKSYYSQFVIFLGFLTFSGIFYYFENNYKIFGIIFFIAFLLSPIYLKLKPFEA